MALYLGGGLIVIVMFAANIPAVLALVFREAFSLRATAGGALGMVVAMRYGLARGMYANEAGYGTASVAYGTARSRHPEQQGLQAVMEVVIVSFVTSTISAMTILLTGAWQSGLTSSAAVASAFDAAMPGFGGYVVALCAFLFGYTTLIGWAFYGEQFFEYLLGRPVAHWYRWIYCLLIPFGAIGRVEVVWAWGDLMNALQIFPNIIGVIGLSGLRGARGPRSSRGAAALTHAARCRASGHRSSRRHARRQHALGDRRRHERLLDRRAVRVRDVQRVTIRRLDALEPEQVLGERPQLRRRVGIVGDHPGQPGREHEAIPATRRPAAAAPRSGAPAMDRRSASSWRRGPGSAGATASGRRSRATDSRRRAAWRAPSGSTASAG